LEKHGAIYWKTGMGRTSRGGLYCRDQGWSEQKCVSGRKELVLNKSVTRCFEDVLWNAFSNFDFLPYIYSFTLVMVSIAIKNALRAILTFF
jgi:hypothetical protein